VKWCDDTGAREGNSSRSGRCGAERAEVIRISFVDSAGSEEANLGKALIEHIAIRRSGRFFWPPGGAGNGGTVDCKICAREHRG